MVVSLTRSEKKRKIPNQEYAQSNAAMGRFFRIGGWVHKSGYYRVFRPHWQIFHRFWGNLIGKLFLDKKKNRLKLQNGLKLLFPDRSNTFYTKIMKGYFAYMGDLVIDMVFNIPLVKKDVTKYINTTGIEYLDEALRQKKGVLMPTLHIGQFFHLLAYLAWLKAVPNKEKFSESEFKYEYVVVGTLENVQMFSVLASQQPNVYAVTTRDYQEMKTKITHHLNKNRIVVLFYDFTKINHLQTPFDGVLPSHQKSEQIQTRIQSFLKPTPQSVIAFHRETKAPIVPAVVTPRDYVSYSTIDFLDPTSLIHVDDEYLHDKEQIYHGEMSMALNKLLHPYIRRYPHAWEELGAFSSWLRVNRLKIPALDPLTNVLETIWSKLYHIFIGTYESEMILPIEEIQNQMEEVRKQLHDPQRPLRNHPVVINCYAPTRKEAISRLLGITEGELRKIGEIEAANSMQSLIHKLS